MTFSRLLLCLSFAVSAAPAFADDIMFDVAQVSAGYTHSCAVMRNTTAVCWGDNGFGQLGIGTYDSRAVALPVLMPGSSSGYLDGVQQIAAGSGFTCALRNDGSVVCWGQNNVGKLGTGDMRTDHRFPTRVLISEPVKAIAAMGEVACALLDTPQRSMRCWGKNSYGQLGDGSTTDRDTPGDVVVTERDGSQKLLAGVTQMSAGFDHVCAVLGDTSVACWGLGWTGELGDGVYTDSHSPVGVFITMPGDPALTGIEQVSANGLHSCAKFSSTSLLACWGNNTQGQLGVPAVSTVTASPVGVVVRVKTVAAGSANTCAMTGDAHVACWGDNSFGQLGVGSTTPSPVPTLLDVMKVTSLSVGAYHACAVLPDTSVKCWGRGDYGQIGNGLRNEINPSPVYVLGEPIS